VRIYFLSNYVRRWLLAGRRERERERERATYGGVERELFTRA
jgi:hypothetical protein